jgi:BRCT domain type II-containing protein
MPSEKLTRILKARSQFSAEQVSALTDAQGWDWVYANANPRKEKLSEICFTGFSHVEKEELVGLAKNARLRVTTAVTKTLSFLCAGENAGPTKLEKAHAQGIIVMNRVEFENLLETGEIPTAPSASS